MMGLILKIFFSLLIEELLLKYTYIIDVAKESMLIIIQ